MRCGKAKKWLSVEIDGELPAERKALLDKHLAQCKSCAEYRAAFLAQERIVKKLEFPEVSTDFRRQVRAKLSRVPEHRQPAFSTVLLRWVPVTAVLGVGLFLGILLGRITAGTSFEVGDKITQVPETEADELSYFSTLPVGGEQDLFRSVIYGSEEDLP